MAGAAPWPSIDVHVHLHPERLADAIRDHFVRQRWVPAHSFAPGKVAETLVERGVVHFCCFTYAHRPGMSRDLNRWLATTAARLPGAVPLGTVHAADPDLEDVVAEAVEALGLRGFKFHLSVQRFGVDDPRLDPVWARAEAEGLLLMLHAGTLPYRDAWTGVARFRRVMARFPRLRACVAHLGCHEHEAFLALTETYPNLYLDTTMALSAAARPWVGGDPALITDATLLRYQDRILFGSDFPLLPYDYDEERRWAWERDLPEAVRRKIFHDNALAFLGEPGGRGG